MSVTVLLFYKAPPPPSYFPFNSKYTKPLRMETYSAFISLFVFSFLYLTFSNMSSIFYFIRDENDEFSFLDIYCRPCAVN